MKKLSVSTMMFLAIILALSVLPADAQSNTQPGTGNPGAQTTPNSPGGAGANQGTTPQSGTDRNPGTAAQSATPIMQAAEMTSAEIELGKIASTKAQNAKVKSFAEMMVKDHTQALTRFRNLQASIPSDVTLNAKHQQTVDRLSKLSGAEFDREYMTAMVTSHQEALAFLEQQSGQSRPAGATSATDSARPGAAPDNRNEPGGAGTANKAGGPPAAGNSSATAGSTATGNQGFASVAQEMLATVRQHLQLAQQIQRELQGGSSPATSGTQGQGTTPNTTPTPGTPAPGTNPSSNPR
jgi:putative membrane protein